MNILLVFTRGFIFLIYAIAVNAIISSLNIKTWYSYINAGFKAGLIDIIFLYLVYPFLLGLGIYLVGKVNF